MNKNQNNNRIPTSSLVTSKFCLVLVALLALIIIGQTHSWVVALKTTSRNG
jgi:hypothetical protein